MIIKTLSATSIKSFEGCPKRYLAELTRVRLDSVPGTFGTAVHAALDWYIKIAVDMGHIDHALAKDVWTTVHNKYLGFESGFEDVGWEMISGYLDRLGTPPPMMSAEIKESFTVTTEDGTEVKVNYICDRVDKHPDPDVAMIRVVDYKTQWATVTPEAMRKMVQPNLYAVAMRRKYGASHIEVVYEMVRHHQSVAVVFTPEDMDRTERYLADVAQRILDDDDPMEKLNPDCIYCIRKGVCATLRKATELGWTPTMPLDKLVERRAEAASAMKANASLVDEIDTVLLGHMRENDLFTDDIGEYEVSVSVRKTGAYDPVTVFATLGPSALKYMKVGKTALDKDMKRKTGGFSQEERTAIEESLTTTYGDPTIRVEKKGIDL